MFRLKLKYIHFIRKVNLLVSSVCSNHILDSERRMYWFKDFYNDLRILNSSITVT